MVIAMFNDEMVVFEKSLGSNKIPYHRIPEDGDFCTTDRERGHDSSTGPRYARRHRESIEPSTVGATS